MNNYSYITLLTDDSYIFGIMLLQKSLKDVQSEYPLKVLVTSNVSVAVLNILEQLELNYKIIEPIKSEEMLEYNKKINSQFARNWVLTLTKFEIFGLIEYDKIIFLDADILVLKNLDHLFECPHMTSALDGEYFNIWPNNPHFNAGILIIEPNLTERDQLIQFSKQQIKNWKKEECIADQEILNLYFSDWVSKTELHLNKYYDVFAPYVEEEYLEDIKENAYFIHFIGRKPWRLFHKPDFETYSEYFYELAHNLVQEITNTLDWDLAKKTLKLAIYGICKDEILNIEKYIKCFTKADYVCLLDTGSTDGTWEFLLEAQSQYPNLIIKQQIIDPWRYDTARNISLELVPKDTNIYFMIDLDEIIKTEDWIEQIKNSWQPLFSRGAYIYNRQVDKETDVPIQQFVEYRIHNGSWHYEGLVHEQLCDIVGERRFPEDGCIMPQITVWHYPTNPNRESYIYLCEQGVKDQPNNWVMHLQLAAEYEVHEKYEQAIEEYKNILIQQDTLALPEIGRCYASLGKMLYMKEHFDEAYRIFAKGRKVVPDYSDNYFLAAEIYYHNQQYNEAFQICKEGLANCHESYWCTIVSPHSYYPYFIMGLSQYCLGNKIEGLGYLAIARAKNNNKEISNIFNNIINEIIIGG